MNRTRTAWIAGLAIALGTAPFVSAAPTDATKCLATKIKIVGKYEACRYKAEALAVTKALATDNSKCETKFADSWSKAETTYGLDCPTTGDQTSINTDTSGHVDLIVATLKNLPPCGNSIIQGGEQCDGANLDGETCASQGYDDGTLACTAGCLFDTSACAVHDCDLLTQDCVMGGTACYPLGASQVCAGEGAATDGASCMFANSCIGGLACVAGTCTPICDTVDSIPGCGVGQTCTSQPIWGTNVGYCEDL